MAVLKASKLKDSLRRAKKIGIIEESINLGDVPVVLRNLQPEEMEHIVAEADEFDDVVYYHTFQLGHVCRAIVEIDGQDLRDVDFVEYEIDQGPDKPPEVRVIERHEWLKQEYVKTWGREAISVAFRKVNELFVKADVQMKEGVQFDYAEESPEDKYRRLLSEVKEAEGQVQDEELRKAILDEHGYLPATTPEERAAIQARMEEFAKERVEQAAQRAEPEPAAPALQPPQNAPVAPPPQRRPPPPTPAPEAAGALSGPSPNDLMANRRPLNQDAIEPPVPQQPQSRPVRPARAQVPQKLPPNVPEQPRQLTAQEAAELAANGQGHVASRQAQIQAEMAAMGELDPNMAAELEQARNQAATRARDQIPELARKAETVDGKEAVSILDKRPTGGINPRYKPRV